MNKRGSFSPLSWFKGEDPELRWEADFRESKKSLIAWLQNEFKEGEIPLGLNIPEPHNARGKGIRFVGVTFDNRKKKVVVEFKVLLNTRNSISYNIEFLPVRGQLVWRIKYKVYVHNGYKEAIDETFTTKSIGSRKTRNKIKKVALESS